MSAAVNDRRRGRRSGGFVLIIVLWVLALMIVITMGFSRRVLLEGRSAALHLDRVQAQAMARGAVYRGIEAVSSGDEVKEIVARWMAENPQLVRQQMGGEPELSTSPIGEYDAATLFTETLLLEGEDVKVVVQDEERRFNINETPQTILEEMEVLSFRQVNAIMERLSAEEESKPVPLRTLEELFFLRGIGDEEWAGERGQPGLRDLFTVYGDGKININTASARVLALLPDVDESMAEQIEAHTLGEDGLRDTADDQRFESVADIGEALGIDSSALSPFQRYCKSNSDFFRIVGVATRRNGRIRARCTAVVTQVEGEDGNVLQVLEWKEQVSAS